jgi:hypothetical protein
MNKSRAFMTAVLALGSVLAAGVARAEERGTVQWGITMDAPGYSQGAHAYGPPGGAYGQRPYQRPTRWDRDGDGIPNRHDRFYNPPWDRDGDGVPNRYDRHDDSRRVYGDPRGRNDGPGWHRRP